MALVGEGEAGSLEQATRPVSPTCKICTLPGKDLPLGQHIHDTVETMYSRGSTVAAIHRAILDLTETWPEEDVPSRDSLERHTARHLGWLREAARVMLLRRLDEQHDVDEAAVQRLVDARDTARLMHETAREEVASGRLKPQNFNEAIRAVELDRSLEREDEDRTPLAYLISQVSAISAGVKEVVPEEQWEEIQRRVKMRLDRLKPR